MGWGRLDNNCQKRVSSLQKIVLPRKIAGCGVPARSQGTVAHFGGAWARPSPAPRSWLGRGPRSWTRAWAHTRGAIVLEINRQGKITRQGKTIRHAPETSTYLFRTSTFFQQSKQHQILDKTYLGQRFKLNSFTPVLSIALRPFSAHQSGYVFLR